MRSKTIKSYFILFLVFLALYLFSFSSFSNTDENLADENTIIFNTTREIIFDNYSFSFADIDLIYKLIFGYRDIDIVRIESDLIPILLEFRDLFNVQYGGLKGFLISYFEKNKADYKLDIKALNQLYNVRMVSELLLYNENLLSSKRTLNFENNDQIINLKFEDSIENYLYYIMRMFN